MLWQMFFNGTKKITKRVLLEIPASILMTLPNLMSSFIGFRKIVDLCIHISGFYPEYVPFPLSFSALYLPVGSQVVNMHWCLPMQHTLVVRHDKPFRDVRRNKL